MIYEFCITIIERQFLTRISFSSSSKCQHAVFIIIVNMMMCAIPPEKNTICDAVVVVVLCAMMCYVTLK